MTGEQNSVHILSKAIRLQVCGKGQLVREPDLRAQNLLDLLIRDKRNGNGGHNLDIVWSKSLEQRLHQEEFVLLCQTE